MSTENKIKVEVHHRERSGKRWVELREVWAGNDAEALGRACRESVDRITIDSVKLAGSDR